MGAKWWLEWGKSSNSTMDEVIKIEAVMKQMEKINTPVQQEKIKKVQKELQVWKEKIKHTTKLQVVNEKFNTWLDILTKSMDFSVSSIADMKQKFPSVSQVRTIQRVLLNSWYDVWVVDWDIWTNTFKAYRDFMDDNRHQKNEESIVQTQLQEEKNKQPITQDELVKSIKNKSWKIKSEQDLKIVLTEREIHALKVIQRADDNDLFDAYTLFKKNHSIVEEIQWEYQKEIASKENNTIKSVENKEKLDYKMVLSQLGKYIIRTAGGLERAIWYAKLDNKNIQTALKKAWFYKWSIDWDIWPLSLSAYKQYKDWWENVMVAKNEKRKSRETGRNKIIRWIPVRIVGTDKWKINIQKYWDKIIPEVIKVAKKYWVEKAFVLAIIDQEGEYNPYARSHVWAEWLMQLMPRTAKDMWISNSTSIKQNLDGWTKYISQQLRSFGTKELALAAYNAGPWNVRKYKGIPPFGETKDYISKVMKNYSKYKKIEHKIA